MPMTFFPSILFLLALGFFNPPGACASDLNLPDFGDSLSGVVSHQQEYELGQAWLRMYRNRVPYYNDPQLEYYLEQLLHQIALHSGLTNKDLELIMVSNPTINAFAAPGGIIGVHSGLFLMAENEAELASVLSHELAHLSQRHWVRSVAASKQNTLPTLAGMLAGLVLIATSNGAAGMAAITSTQAANLDSMLRFSRQSEQEADRIGMQTLIEAGFNPEAMTDMFELMLNSQRFQGKRPPEYLLSHPVTERRIADSRLRQPNINTQLITDSPEYHLMRARVQLHHTETPQMAVKRFQSELDGSTGNQIASQYGLALSLSAAKQFDAAEKIFSALAEKDPAEITFSMGLAQNALERGNYAAAESQLLKIKNRNHAYYPADLMLAKVYVSSQQYTKAEKTLDMLSRRRPEDPHIWYQLAEAHGLAQNIPGVHLARAEYFILNGVYDQAKTQLQYAQALLKDNFVATERIKQKLLEIEKLEKFTLDI